MEKINCKVRAIGERICIESGLPITYWKHVVEVIRPGQPVPLDDDMWDHSTVKVRYNFLKVDSKI
jgi:hypothetical protein